MDNVTMAANGLLPKINSLFNNPLYSDVQFIFLNKDGTCERIYCHKLILALQSKVFAHLFFEKETSPSKMEMQASKKQMFHHLFKFMYTGDIHIQTFNEAQNLYELANDFSVEELMKKCHSYMLQSKLTIENLFLRYEHALKQQIDMLLIDCRNFLCSNVETVLNSDEFTNASPEVIKDIIKLDNLPLDSELKIITAVLKWGSESIRKNGTANNEKNLRKSVDPFLKHLRILTLSSVEFEYLVKHYNLFTAYESMVLIKKIMNPESSDKLPENFCYITTRRNATVFSTKISDDCQQYKPVKSNSPMSTRSDLPKSTKPNNNKVSYEVTKYQTKNSSSFSTNSNQKFNSSPNINYLKFPAPNFSQNFPRDFLFPLKEIEKSFTLSFHKDVKCSVIMEMKSGNLVLYGLEFKIKNKNEKKELIEVCIYLKGFSKQCISKSFNLEMQNGIQYLKFPEPVNLQEGNKGIVEVCIENLSVDRCYQINKKLFELNSGLNFKCKFCIDSNIKTNNESFLFLINKLLYAPF